MKCNYAFYNEIIYHLQMRDETKALDCGVSDSVLYQKIKKAKTWCHYTGMSANRLVVEDNTKKHKKATWVFGHIDDIPFDDDKFGVVIAHDVLCYLKGYEKAIDEMHRVTNDYVLIYVREYKKDLKAYLKGKFNVVVEAFNQDSNLGHFIVCRKGFGG